MYYGPSLKGLVEEAVPFFWEKEEKGTIIVTCPHCGNKIEVRIEPKARYNWMEEKYGRIDVITSQ